MRPPLRLAVPIARRSSRRTELFWGIASLLTLATILAMLIPKRTGIDPGTAALIMLIAPLVATPASLRVALASGVISALAFNFFFTRPYDHWHIEAGTSVVAFVMYLALATAVALIMSRLRQAAEASDDRTAHALLLRDLTIDLARQNVLLRPPLDAALAKIATALHLRAATLAIDIPGGEQFVAGARRADSTQQGLRVLPDLPGQPRRRRRAPALDGVLHEFPIETSDEDFGVLTVELSHELLGENAEQLLGLFANVVALACERAAFMQQSVERKALEETDRLRIALMQAVSHDLRTPLASISALASTLPEIRPLHTEQEQMLTDIVHQTERLAKLVDQVLDVSRIESGNLKLHLQTVPLDEVIRAAVSDIQGSVGPMITVTLPDDAPAVPVDELLIKQALVNLLENATRYGLPPIEVTLEERETLLELRVADRGPGIPEELRPHIFDPAFAMRHTSSDERSRGLGLVISAGFIAAHHGDIRVEQTPGGGATFVISLPKLPTTAAPLAGT